ncbi:MAG: hypothetical protein Q8N96_01200 [Methylovulum sp.]|nr:hypothetical protein [Methylovulum sp.]
MCRNISAVLSQNLLQIAVLNAVIQVLADGFYGYGEGLFLCKDAQIRCAHTCPDAQMACRNGKTLMLIRELLAVDSPVKSPYSFDSKLYGVFMSAVDHPVCFGVKQNQQA